MYLQERAQRDLQVVQEKDGHLGARKRLSAVQKQCDLACSVQTPVLLFISHLSYDHILWHFEPRHLPCDSSRQLSRNRYTEMRWAEGTEISQRFQQTKPRKGIPSMSPIMGFEFVPKARGMPRDEYKRLMGTGVTDAICYRNQVYVNVPCKLTPCHPVTTPP